ncbi:NAD(P)-binding Rossmann-fold containing protein-9 [Coleophoma crateriformis]|uniref:NAD(P)-binding Rossmann-fold containing protein-9 n=1 Tax=Coleophoma crateriformis TaxID=565419 RepID=A0A3D8QIN5_9HELO|nr:NAD(P)-binding Rossmann-fold containing protein-9 [Coleophoma crateriformis]
MSNNLQGKVIALTGGASGLGLAGSKMLAARGAKVSIADMQEGALQEAVKDIEAAGGIAMGTVVDVRDRKQVEDWISRTVEKYGKLDGAVNLAGVIGKQIGLANIEDIEDDDWKFIMDINLNGILNCMRAEIKAINDKGSIVNASSIAGIIGMEKNGAYIASKHAVIGLTRASAKELGPRGIRVNAIAPGPIDTPMVRKSKDTAKETDFRNIPLGREGEASEVAELLAWLLCDGSSYITGTVQSIDGGWACH